MFWHSIESFIFLSIFCPRLQLSVWLQCLEEEVQVWLLPKDRAGGAFERTVLVFHKMIKKQKDHRLCEGMGERGCQAYGRVNADAQGINQVPVVSLPAYRLSRCTIPSSPTHLHAARVSCVSSPTTQLPVHEAPHLLCPDPQNTTLKLLTLSKHLHNTLQ